LSRRSSSLKALCGTQRAPKDDLCGSSRLPGCLLCVFGKCLLMLWIMAIADLFGDAIQLPGIVGAFLAGLAVMSISSNSKSRISRTS
jgi:hypothetical protein